MPPAYYKYGDDNVYSFYANVVQKVPESNIILYNYERLSGYKFSVQVIKKLVKNFLTNFFKASHPKILINPL